jgi:hypothetical protein
MLLTYRQELLIVDDDKVVFHGWFSSEQECLYNKWHFRDTGSQPGIVDSISHHPATDQGSEQSRHTLPMVASSMSDHDSEIILYKTACDTLTHPLQ